MFNKPKRSPTKNKLKGVLIHQSLNQAKSSPKKRKTNDRLDLRFANLEMGNRDLRDQILQTEKQLRSTKEQLLNMHGLRNRRQPLREKQQQQVWLSEKVLLEAKIQRLERKLKEVGHRHEQELKKAYEDMGEVEQTVMSFQKEKVVFNEEKKRFAQLLQKKDVEHQSVQAKVRQLSEYKERAAQEIASLKRQVEKNESDEQKIQDVVKETAMKVRQEHEATITSMQNVVQSLEEQLLNQKNQFEDYETEIDKLRVDLKTLENIVDSYKKEEEEWFSQTAQWQKEQDGWNVERKLLREEISRLQESQSTNSQAGIQMINLEEEIERLRREKDALEVTFLNAENLSEKILQITKEKETLQQVCQERLNELEILRKEVQDNADCEQEFVERIQSLQSDNEACHSKLEAMQIELHEKSMQIEKNDNTILTNLESDMKCLQEECNSLNLQLQTQQQNNKDLGDAIMDLEEELSKQKLKRREEEELRRKLHNEVVELRGNIRVICRVRPFLDGEVPECNFSYPIDNPLKNQLWLQGADQSDVLGRPKPGLRHHFEFDRVFQAQDGQKEVFSEIQHLVQSALDGYKVCIFAFGQTGSGKTYTMEGKASEGECGMIPRAVEHIFRYQKELKEKGWSFEFEASSLEIYNEHICDLLSENPRAFLEVSQRGKEVGVEGLTQVTVASPQEVYPLLARANQNRSVGCTDLNSHSSRSHLIFQIFLNGVNIHSKQERHGVLNLIDLAGSERLKQSNAEGIRREETKHINKSLSALADVIGALGKKKKHIPFRNSKLTFLLQNYLGGDAKTLMFVNLCPGADKIDQSLCSLRFASRVNATELGPARRLIERQRSSFGSRSPRTPRSPKVRLPSRKAELLKLNSPRR